MLDRDGDFAAFLGGPDDYSEGRQAQRRVETTGRPLGSTHQVAAMKAQTGRTLAAQKREAKTRQSG